MNDFWVLDASAILAFLGEEPGADVVKAALYDGAAVSSVNLCEVARKLSDAGLSRDEMMDVFSNMGLEVKDFDSQQAMDAGILLGETRSLGLSLGGRACLNLAMAIGGTALTADHAWVKTGLAVKVRLVR